METDRTFPNPPMFSSHDPPSSTAIYFCSICDKPFTSATSRDRHFHYCGRHKRNRPRSCRACNAAKTKCSFDVPCSRCTKRGIECFYDESVAATRLALPQSAAAAEYIFRDEPSKRPSASVAFGALDADNRILSSGNFAFANDLLLDEAQIQLFRGKKRQQVDLTTQISPPKELLTFDELFAFEDDISGQYQSSADTPLNLHGSSRHSAGSWCTWMRENVSLAVVSENPPTKPNSNLMAVLQLGRPHTQHNADLIIQSLRSFPTMMLRRKTFPWFIHPHSQILSESTGAALPQALSNCMSIAQMFASRTSETKDFLRQTIRAEHGRFTSEMYHMSELEIIAAIQACMIYLIMYIIDYLPEDEEKARELLLAMQDLYLLFKETGGRCLNQSELLKPSTRWEDWIFAESQRRLANLWLLVGCVVCVKNGNQVSDASQSYRNIPLPSSKSLWEAPTQSAWETEYESRCVFHPGRLATLGDLIDAQQSDHAPNNARKLDDWNASVDNLGCLLNLVGTMV